MKKIKTLIIFDFDNTLFKTKEFWREYLVPFYIRIGIARELIEGAFVRATTASVDYFIPKLFIDELYSAAKEVNKYSKKELNDIFEKHIYSPVIKKYFYPDSLRLLEKVKKNYKILLMSYGDKNFKTKFFNYCGLSKYFSPKNIIITNGKKVELLKKLATPKNCIVVNDAEAETKELVSFLIKGGISAEGFLINNKKVAIKKEKNITTCRSLTEFFRKI